MKTFDPDQLGLKTSEIMRDALRQRATKHAQSHDPNLSSLADSLNLLLDDVQALLILLAQRG